MRPYLALAVLGGLVVTGPALAEVSTLSRGAALCLGRIAEELITSRSIKVLEVNEEWLVANLVNTDIVFHVVDAEGALGFRTGSCKIRTGPDGKLSIEEFFLPFAK